jgi:TPR repeat protein
MKHTAKTKLLILALLLCFTVFSQSCSILRLSEDVEKAQKAAEKGDAKAQYELGLFYATGLGVSQDDKKAAFWYLKSAEQGNDKAQNNLGYLYDKGKGVPQDDRKAAFWYQRSAEQGNDEAQFALGVVYEEGQAGLPQDHQKAYQWLSLSAKKHEAAYIYLDSLRSKLTSEQVQTAEEWIHNWKPKMEKTEKTE